MVDKADKAAKIAAKKKKNDLKADAEKAVTTDVAADATAGEVEKKKPEPNPNLLRKKDIYDQVTVATGLRKREVREAVDATFSLLAKAIGEGKDLQLPPLGKVRIINKGEGEKAKTLYRLVLQKPKDPKKDASEGKEALDAAEK